MITPNPGSPAALPSANLTRFHRILCGFGLLLAGASLSAGDAVLGLFGGQTDIGAPAQAGTASRDPATGDYLVGGGGANMWFKADSFHYVWQQVAGNVAIEADISFPASGGNAHRKGVLMFRQSLDADAAYVDVAVHGDGLTSLQFRETKGDITHEVQCLAQGPKRVRLEQIGDYVYLSLVTEKGTRQATGCSSRVAFKAPFYVGIGVCAHDDKAFETVRFSRVVIGAPSAEAAQVRNSIEYVKVPSGDRVCVHPNGEKITSAVWAADGSLYFAQKTGAFRVPASGGQVEAADSTVLPAGQSTAASPDGKWTATFEHQGGDAVLTLRPAAGGEARVLMRLPDQADVPSLISWSADSTKIAYIRSQPSPAHLR